MIILNQREVIPSYLLINVSQTPAGRFMLKITLYYFISTCLPECCCQARMGVAADEMGKRMFTCSDCLDAQKSIHKKKYISTTSKKAHKKSDLWHTAFGMMESRLMLGNVIETSQDYTSLSKGQLRILTGFATDHCRARKQLKRIGLTIQDECRFFSDCEAPVIRRLRCLGAYQLVKSEL